jgi:hypothetical protein
VDYQFARLEEGVVAKARHRLEHEHPDLMRLRYYLMPGDKLQERRLAALEPVAWRGKAVVAGVVDAALEHLAALERGELYHAVVDR